MGLASGRLIKGQTFRPSATPATLPPQLHDDPLAPFMKEGYHLHARSQTKLMHATSTICGKCTLGGSLLSPLTHLPFPYSRKGGLHIPNVDKNTRGVKMSVHKFAFF